MWNEVEACQRMVKIIVKALPPKSEAVAAWCQWSMWDITRSKWWILSKTQKVLTSTFFSLCVPKSSKKHYTSIDPKQFVPLWSKPLRRTVRCGSNRSSSRWSTRLFQRLAQLVQGQERQVKRKKNICRSIEYAELCWHVALSCFILSKNAKCFNPPWICEVRQAGRQEARHKWNKKGDRQV